MTAIDLGSEIPGPIELRDPTLGRMLAPRWTVGTIMKVSKIPREGISADEFAARFLATFARSVPDVAPADQGSYEAAVSLAKEAFTVLSPDALDHLAGAYLEQTAASMVIKPRKDKKGAAAASGPLPEKAQEKLESGPDQTPERQTERLFRLVKTSVEDLDALMRTVPQTLSGLFNIGNDLKRSFARTSLLSHGLDKSLIGLANMRASSTRGIIETSAEPFKFDIPPNPIVETNRQLSELSAAIDDLVKIGEQQAALARSLTETSQLALEQAIKSGNDASVATRQARNGVWLAAIAIIISICLGIGTIVDSHNLTSATDARIDTLNDTDQTLADFQRQNATNLEALPGTAGSLAKMADAMSKSLESSGAYNQEEIGLLRDLSRQLQNVEAEFRRRMAAKTALPNKR